MILYNSMLCKLILYSLLCNRIFAHMEFAKTHSAGFLANHMARLFAAGLQQRFKELDLAPAQFMVLLELWEEDGLTQAVLTDRLDVEQATMANTLSRMQRDGLIDRIANPKDKRTRVIKLTPKAREVRQKALTAAATQNAEALKGLNEQEAETLIALMQKVILTLKRR